MNTVGFRGRDDDRLYFEKGSAAQQARKNVFRRDRNISGTVVGEAREKNRNRNRNKMRNLRNSMAIGKAYNKLFFLYIGRNRKMSI